MGGRKLIPLRGYAARERRWKRGEQESMSGEIFGLVGSFSPLPKAALRERGDGREENRRAIQDRLSVWLGRLAPIPFN